MAYKYDILLKNGIVADYATDRDVRSDVGIQDGKVVEIATEINPTDARDVYDVAGQYVVPGIIDIHTHFSTWIGGRYGHKMLALAGVTTSLDMAGPVAGVWDMARDYGAGLNVASIEYVRPEHTVKDTNPGQEELQVLLDRCLQQGAIGLKLLGGHYPLTPDATARAIELVNRNKAYIAFHCGTLQNGSNIEGFLEAVKLSAGNALHIAHINSYTRGLKRPYMVEMEEAVAALIENPAIRSESYLSPMNGTSAKCSNGAPESLQTQTNLSMGGFEKTEKGFEEAIRFGWANINMEEGGRMVLATGERAVAYWRELGTDATVSFKVNPPEPRIRLAVAKRPNGGFVVDCISTDGGGIPRNVIVSMGLSLVKLQALTMKEFVQKSSYNPARILGLSQKGHFRQNADADITVLDLEKQEPVMSLVGGKVIMFRGHVCGAGSQAITTQAGESFVRSQGLTPVVVDLSQSGFYQGL
ncbi:MAG: amidohydrolase family protein [Negativicutes bacterium]